MNFEQFIASSKSLRARDPGLTWACETRIAAALAPIRPQLDLCEPPRRLHRCDLARLWCQRRGLSEARARTALVNCGVRHALALLFADMAASGQRLALPTDVYPVYWQLAGAAGLATTGIATFPELDTFTLVDAAERTACTALLLPNPLKIHGRWLDPGERAVLTAWLRADPRRRLILDGVYAFGRPLDPGTLELLDSGQVLYLDSLSKGWLHAKVFGVAHVPERDFARLAPIFRAAAPTQANLHLAARLLDHHHHFPARLVAELDDRRLRCRQRLCALGLTPLPADNGYFLAVDGLAAELAITRRIVLLPGSVFGELQRPLAIASALPPAP